VSVCIGVKGISRADSFITTSSSFHFSVVLCGLHTELQARNSQY
jgi:hypothetical protein